ncbi:MAG: alpha/beta hydrolase [Actinomycetota bacterium]|nr:alpha/beta hydrolase [Actinomycetota bacterium]
MTQAEEATTTITVGGQSARLLDVGTGDAVVVLHGWGGRIESMDPVIRCLAPRFRIIALDLPGFGESPLPSTLWGTPEYAGFVRDALVRLDVTSASFVAHSYGAKVALYIAATYRSVVQKLVLVGSSGLRTAPSMKARVKRAASRTARVTGKFGPPGRALRDAAYRRLASADYRDAGELRPILVKVVNEDLGRLLPAITASTLLVWGSADDAVPLAHARRMEKLIPDAGLVVLEGAGHFAYLDEPERFCRVTRHFLGAPISP